MLKRLTAYSTIALALCACSDEAYILPNGIGEDGSLDIRLAVPQMQQVATRATDEYAVSNLTMLVLSGGEVAQMEQYDAADLKELGSNQYSLSVSIAPELRGATDLKFYFIANSPAADTDLDLKMTEADITGVTYSQVVNDDETMPMCGSASLTDLTGGNSVALWRNAAKVTVQNGTVDEEGEVTEGNVHYDFSVFSTAGSAALLAAAQSPAQLGEATSATPLPTAVDAEEAAYVHPTRNEGVDAQERPFTVLKAPYGGTEYYYRVDFRNKTEEGSVEDIDIEPNHWYKIVVTAVNGAGATTVAEAAANPSPLVEAIVYDVAPESYNIITDGTRELGVSHEIVYEGEANGTANVFVKLYSPNESEYPEATVEAWKGTLVSTTYKWLSLVDVEDVSGDPAYAGVASGEFAATAGKLYRLEVNFGETSSPGTLNAEISVDWKGLNRMIPVKWVREFSGEDLCTVMLTIDGYNSAGNAVKYEDRTDYWVFLKNRVYGASESQNGGNIRNEGLHFPVMYGESGKLWQYTYEITYNEKIFNDAAYDWKIETEGVTGLTLSRTSGSNETGALTVTVSRPLNDWDYATGQMTLYVAAAGTTEYTKYPLDLYHTGFFHDHTAKIDASGKSTADFRVGGDPNPGYYYYEVLTGPNGNHWLDRNLGATASGLYIEATGGVAYHGNAEAAGGHYRAAAYNKGGDPVMYAGLCPPGFEIPREEIWNSVRNSTSFDTSSVGNYYNAALRATNGMYIYFPKALYYAEDTKTGESRAGYYWSSTAASGLEKDQIGNWLRCLQISGNVTTFINGQVQGREGANGYAMSVRCVGKTVASGESYRTSFNVIGATHVYIYSLNADGSRNAVTTWPGKPIGNAETMTDGQMMNFSYESATTPATSFYVIFSYKDASGIIHTVSKAPDGSTLYSINQNPANLTGWKVVGDQTVSGNSTALDGTWKVTSPTAEGANVYFNDSPFFQTEAGKITIYCWNLEGWDEMYCHYTYQGVNQNVAGEKRTDYWPQLYKYEIPDTDVTRLAFANHSNNNEGFANGNVSNTIVAGSYYNNVNINRNAILPSEISEPAPGTWRIAIRPVFGENKAHYIYDWGGTDACTSSNIVRKPMTSLLSGKYYYYDIYENATGFLLHNGKWSSDGGQQTLDLNWTGYKEGKLLQQWTTVTLK
ncbi:MAG: fibrobacter succinogenes major paralogous domain-containing protein [Muribaculaceae bacterium]|nr:fibrobacter succinogenes major paralogous domain-containing protein [Muribaculaceae bacterium]